MSGSTSNSSKNISNNNSKHVVDRQEGIGQGELYSPDHAIKINTQQNNIRQNNNDNNNNFREEEGSTMVGRGVVSSDIRNRMRMVKDRVLEKLTAASVPSDKLENARTFLETIIRDVTSAAQGITKEALQRIKSHLADILPSVSPSLTSKIVDDAENEAAVVTGCENGASDDKRMIMEEDEKVEEQRKTVSASPTSSFFSSYHHHLVRPFSRL